jgi:hypothetical protein
MQTSNGSKSEIPEETKMRRRDFMKMAAAVPFARAAGGTDSPALPTFEEYLRGSAVTREVIDRFLSGPGWAQIDPETGYILSNYLPTDGMDGSATISTVQANGARTSFLYAGRKCRINTYGNSFTQCHQVSDGETWQEYLAAHLGEPIRNFGMGGYGVYQAYRRLLKEESSNLGAEYVVLYVWGDDPIRSLLRCRHAAIYKWWNDQGGPMFHGNFWANLEMDLQTGQFAEKPNLCPSHTALYNMTDPQFMVDHLKDDLALQLLAYKDGNIRDLDEARVRKLAECLNFPVDLSQASTRRQQAGELLDAYSLSATQYILAKTRDFCRQNNKKLLVLLFDPYRAILELHTSGTRYDQPLVDYLHKENFLYFDMNLVHLEDYRQYNLSFEAYLKEYIRGHYNPRGNHFFAYSLKDTVVNWLDPKPITYSNPNPETVDFKGYLAGYH